MSSCGRRLSTMGGGTPRPHRPVPLGQVDVFALGGGLGIDDEVWLRGIGMDLATGGVELPDGPDLSAALRRLGVVEADLEEVVAAAPDPDRTPELWWLLERSVQRVVRTLHRGDGEWERWPAPDESRGPGMRCFWVYVYLAAVPEVRRWHRERGIPDEVSWATLADLGRHVWRYRHRFGAPGLEPECTSWFRHHFSGGLYALGRLQFAMQRLSSALSECGLAAGAPVLGVHIPESGPMSPEACDESFRLARTFFPRYFPEQSFRVATCGSWLLDDQLEEYLPATSNIVRFQKRFHLLPEARDGDRDIFWFVFDRPPDALDTLEPCSTLRRAILSHVRSGRHWRVRSGWLEL